LQYKLLATRLHSLDRVLEDEQIYLSAVIEGLAQPSNAIRALCTTILTGWIEGGKIANGKEGRKSFVQQQLHYKMKASLSTKTSQFFRQTLDIIK